VWVLLSTWRSPNAQRAQPRFADVQVADWRLVIVEGKGGHHRVVPSSSRFFDALGAYPHDERPAAARTKRLT